MDSSNSALFQGVSNAGSGFAQAINRYRDYKEKSSMADGAIAAGIQNNQEALASAPDDIKKLLDKHTKAETGYNDKLKLAGYLSAYSTGKTEKQAQQAAAQKLQDATDAKAQQDAAITRNQKLTQYMDQGGDAGNSPLSNSARAGMSDRANNLLQVFAANTLASTGRLPDPATLERMAGQSLKSDSKAFDVVKYRDVDDKGNPIEVAVNKATGQKIASSPIQAPKFVNTPEEQIRIAGATAGAQADNKNASDFVNSITDAAEQAQIAQPHIKKIKDLYAAGATSGAGSDFITKAGSYAASLGLIKPQQQASREELQALLANQALSNAQQLMKGQGSVSEGERALIQKASADINKSPAANLKIIEHADQLANRSLAAEQQRQALVDQGKSTSDIAEHMRRWRLKNPLSNFSSASDDAKPAAPAAKSAVQSVISAATQGWNSDAEKRRRELLSKAGGK